MLSIHTVVRGVEYLSVCVARLLRASGLHAGGSVPQLRQGLHSAAYRTAALIHVPILSHCSTLSLTHCWCALLCCPDYRCLLQFTGVLREPGMHCPINMAGMERINVNTAVQSIEIAKVKVVDVRGNPLMVSGVVTFQIIDTKKAALDVKFWQAYLNTQAGQHTLHSIQHTTHNTRNTRTGSCRHGVSPAAHLYTVCVHCCIPFISEVVLKQICSSHPYESRLQGEDSLKSEASKVRREIVQLLQAKVTLAGVHVMNFEFKELSYAPEIAGSMLVRQQAEALIEARQVVVEGGVRIAWEAITHLRSAGLTISDTEASRLASNLVLTICSESRVTPTIQLGS